ncbi:hypothetical protein [Mycobacterium aquaticum]|jgi:hypothetical protein|uniref:Uncharacterized protein n=1 Tax=Mycobacterium aquaticum TaxID=1927124 RepID=A0A1X0AII9_9MYCO|nr:hypothetical protein [Mycobacterium aquaticum]ORA29889.1 hypothetical protein BST13_26450 [Mycobacterium aquaticum]
MVQLDVFWSYSIGASLALSATHQLRSAARAPRHTPIDRPRWQSALTDPYLTATMLFCAGLFAPSGAWLLWGFTSWETMHAAPTHDALPVWLVAVFAATNTTQGVLGYLVTRWLITRGHMQWAFMQMVAGYFALFFILSYGWNGTGYQRFFSADATTFAHWTDAPASQNIRAWATSPVALTLYALLGMLVVVMLFIMGRWHADGLRLTGRLGPRPLVALGLWATTMIVTLAAALTTGLLVHLLGWIPTILFAAAITGGIVTRRNGIAERTVKLFGINDTTTHPLPATASLV